jgi:hypothetical protein
MADEIPDQIRDMMDEAEIENMESRSGWATGTAKEVNSDGRVTTTHEGAWIELFNGDGGAGEFGGVRFMAVTDGEYEEAYAYPDREFAERHSDPPYFYIASFNEDDVDYGKPIP